ncbi:hypothetical protein NOVO_03755 [Rickettsiales bacterium Ac37b]|nr:hypothetical protein NOVO_03755 [Rickettsiales bacterium Ac37b]
MNLSYFFSVIIASFYSKPLYQNVYRKWQSYNFLFIFIVIALTSIPATILWVYKVYTIDLSNIPYNYNIDDEDTSSINESNAILKNIIEQFPKITIENGIIYTNSREPIYIINPANSKVIAIIDTTEHISSLAGTDALLLITRKEIMFKAWWQEGKTIRYYITELLPNNNTVIVTPDNIKLWISSLRTNILWFIPFILYPINIFIAFISNLLRILFYTTCGMALTKIKNLNLSYPGLLRTQVLASVPYIIYYNVLLPIIAYFIPFKSIHSIFLLISIGYSIFAFKAILDLKETPNQ